MPSERFGMEPSISETEPFQEDHQILSEFDRKYLYAGARGMFEKLLKDSPKELPRAIILPDTSARPLVYLLRPIFERVAATRKVETPNYYFLSPTKSFVSDETETPKIIRHFKELGWLPEGLKTEEEISKYIQGEIDQDTKDWSKKIEDPDYTMSSEEMEGTLALGFKGELLERMRPIKQGLELTAKRVQDVLNAVDGSAVIIDDYAYQGRTIGSIARTEKGLVPSYVLMAAPGVEDENTMLHIQAGVLDPDREGSRGFLYRDDKQAIGTEKIKGSPISSPLEGKRRDVVRMAMLRREMAAIGSRVAKELLPEAQI